MILTIALVLSCFMGLYQEMNITNYKINLLYTVSLKYLFYFILFYNYNIQKKKFFFLLICMLIFFFFLHCRYVCISGVHRLQSISSSLTVNFVLNLRKFISLILSVL